MEINAMSGRIAPTGQGSVGNGNLSKGEPPRTLPHGFWWKVWQITKTVQARLRFIMILAAIGGVLVYWDTLKAHYEKWTRPQMGEAAVSADTEYWCPMHPTIVRDHPDNCPICGMPLSKRKKGEGKGAEEALAPGVVSRVQLTPYRVALAGVQSAEIDYQPLSKEINTVGFVEFDERKLARITARPSGKSRIDKLYVNVTGQTVEKGERLALLYSPELVTTVRNLLDGRNSGNRDLLAMSRERLRLWDIDDNQIDEILRADGKPLTHVTVRSPIAGHVIRKYQVEGEYVEEGGRLYDVADLSTVWIEAQVYEDDVAFLHDAVEKKLSVTAVTKSFPDREFKGEVAFIYPHLDASTRTLKVRFDMENPQHELRPGMYATVTLQVPANRLNLLPPEAGEEQKQAYNQGMMLAVPERAVIDSGSRKIVYREAEPDVYEGVEVQLGPRCGPFYPVIRGLQTGDRVATAGSFLIDAETRLTAGAASTYFGASAGPQAGDRHSTASSARPSMTRDEEDKVGAVLDKLGPDDRRLVEAQGFCPVLNDNRLGSMGKPVKVMVKGQPIFLCCKACVNKSLSRPQETLAKVEQLKKRTTGAPPTGLKAPAVSEIAGRESKEVKVKAALAKLSAEDRQLAEAQGFCPKTGAALGSMGVPVKVILKGQPVFLCCKNCVDDAEEHSDQALAKVQELKAKVKASRSSKRVVEP
jgi:multidrug efflux pump subunit AcrA (membrane-fusion protein)